MSNRREIAGTIVDARAEVVPMPTVDLLRRLLRSSSPFENVHNLPDMQTVERAIGEVEAAMVPCSPDQALSYVNYLLAAYPQFLTAASRLNGDDTRLYVTGLARELRLHPSCLVKQIVETVRRQCKYAPSIAELADLAEKASAMLRREQGRLLALRFEVARRISEEQDRVERMAQEARRKQDHHRRLVRALHEAAPSLEDIEAGHAFLLSSRDVGLGVASRVYLGLDACEAWAALATRRAALIDAMCQLPDLTAGHRMAFVQLVRRDLMAAKAVLERGGISAMEPSPDDGQLGKAIALAVSPSDCGGLFEGDE